MRNRTLVPDAGEVTLNELKTDVQNRLVMVLRSVGEESHCPGCGRNTQQQRRDRRLNLYESVMELVRNGMSQRDISERLGIERRTVRRWSRACEFPGAIGSFYAEHLEAYASANRTTGRCSLLKMILD
jgi:hypothetical protein